MNNQFARLFRGPGMQACFRTKNFLAATTAMTTVFLPAVSLGVGLVAFPTGEALADDPISIPLEYVGEGHDRLGIWAKINNGNAQRYVFDTGSDQLNTQIGSEVTGSARLPTRLTYIRTGTERMVISFRTWKLINLHMSIQIKR
ncbi:hypothetical protein [Mesorhizobium sp.]|uniref:hypothetical protein n=1 Tax=Mesorhizobium sp. TaxID=1871066 RepID=UPI000FE408DB|nr:hypothetical protein [Mesorhizobium sp.]RWJ98468.1 MAG: hypothetical protein EOR42_26890 [Mesorhizobium sp.]